MPTPADEIRFTTLTHGVEEKVKAGQSITIGRNDTARRIGRYLDTQKRFMAMNATTFILTATIAVLGGPIAAAVALAGSVVGLGLSTAWDRWSRSRSKGKYEKKKKAGLTLMTTETIQGTKSDGTPDPFESKKLNEGYSEVVDDVKNMLSKQGLTDVYNALANLDVDFLRLKKFISSPKIEGAWTQGTFGATRAGNQGPAGNVRLLHCNDAVELWETMKLVDNRFETLRETAAMIDEFIMYTALVTSQYEADERKLLKQAWQIIQRNHTSRNTVNCKGIYDTFNNAIKREGIQHYAGRHLGRTKDYAEWIYQMIPDYIKDAWPQSLQTDMALELLRRTNKDKFEKVKNDIVVKYIAEQKKAYLQAGYQITKDMSKEYLAAVVAIPDVPSSWGDAAVTAGSTVKGVGITVGSAFLTSFLNGTQSEAWQIKYAGADAEDLAEAATQTNAQGNQDTAKSLLDPVTFSKGFTAQHGMAIATAVVKVAVEVANAAWNEHKLATGKTLGLTGMRQQSVGERIGTLRTFAKQEIDDYISNLEEWEKAHTILEQASFPDKLYGAFLMHMKCVTAKYSNRTGQFFEEFVSIANEMSMTAENYTGLAEEAVKKFVATTNHSRTCRGNKYCYGPASDALKGWLNELGALDAGLAQDLSSIRIPAGWEKTPARSIEGDALELYRDGFISTLKSKDLRRRVWEAQYGDD